VESFTIFILVPLLTHVLRREQIWAALSAGC